MTGDVRVKCRRCRRWMRFHPTAATPVTRRPAPHATTCTECAVAIVRTWPGYNVEVAA